MSNDFGNDDLGAKAAKKGKDGWGEGRIKLAQQRMKRLVKRFETGAKIATKRKHAKHATALTALAKLAKTEYDRLVKLDKLDGLGADDFLAATDELAEMGDDLGIDLPRPGGGLGWGLAGLVLGVIIGAAGSSK